MNRSLGRYFAAMKDTENAYTFHWQHGPAPGLTFYSGRETAYGPDEETAMARAKRAVCQRGCFSPNCITIRLAQD